MNTNITQDYLLATPTNCYLVSLAASDGIFLAASTVTELKYLHSTESASCFDWFHYFGCVFFSFIPYLAINTSSLSITAFTIERYFGICDPIRASYMCTVKRAKSIILGIWLFSIIYNSPWLYLVDLKLNHTEYICNFRLNRDHFAYKVVKMLGIVVVIFAICWLPYRAMVAYNSFASHKWAPDWYIYASKTMIFINCAINPIVYNLMSAKFRNAFSRLLHANSKAIYEKASKKSKAMKMMCQTLDNDNCYKDRTTTEVTALLQ
uniref:Thyrotropin-releasing hormone receptor n=1 Tax=Syphacia muris TaxID=451379 RepID=A0A0N5AH17_9BILA